MSSDRQPHLHDAILDGQSPPPIPGAKLGRDPQGNPAWFVPDPDRPGKYLQVATTHKQ